MQTPSRIAAGVVAGAVALAATGFGAAAAAEYTARIGHLESPTQPRHKGLEKVKRLVAERTGGAVELQIFPSGQLGTGRELNEGVQLGTIESNVGPAAFLGGFNPAVAILDIPYLLPADPEKARAILTGPFGEAVLETFGPKGFKALTLWPMGRKQFTSNKPLADVDDFEGQRFRVMDSKILIEQFNAVGASAIVLPFGELYTALQTGVVDGQENPLDTISTMKFHEVQKNLVISDHGAMVDVVLFNPAWWESLPSEHREVIETVFREVIPEVHADKLAAQDEALEKIKAAGVTIRRFAAEQKERLRARMYPRAKEAYLERAGDVGAKLIEIYEREYERIVGG